jgi:hypothetical protein
VRRMQYPIAIMALRGNGLLGGQHQEVLALFRTLDPTLKRYVMSHAVEVLAITSDIKTAVEVLLHMSGATATRPPP